jgi:hypothetical protein
MSTHSVATVAMVAMFMTAYMKSILRSIGPAWSDLQSPAHWCCPTV